MNRYLKNLLPRLRQYGKKLDHIELIVDRTWVLADDSSNIRTYRFKRNNTLRITVNGNFTDCRWELEGLDAIAVSAPGQNYGEMFRHGFVLNGLLVVQKEGNTALPTIFYDEAVVPDGDLEGYIRRELINQMKLQRLRGNEEFYMNTTESADAVVGKQVYDANLEPVESATVDLGNKIIQINGGRISRVTNVLRFTWGESTIYVQSVYSEPQEGDRIYKINGDLSDGIYKVVGNGERYKFDVAAGVIKKVQQINSANIALVVVVAVIVVLAIIAIAKPQNDTREPLVAAVTNTDATNTTITSPDSAGTSTGTFVSSAPVIPDAPDTYKSNELKQVVRQYFENINNRNWSEISRVFPLTLKNYYGATNVNYSEVMEKLRSYWGEGRTTGIIYDVARMTIEPIEEGYRVTAPVLELGTEGFYRTPIWVSADLFVDVSTNNMIVGIFSKVGKKTYDVYRMFNLDEDITLSDLAARNSTSDWYSILSKVKSVASETPSEFPKYKEAVLNTYSTESRVTINGLTIYLSEYLDKLASGEETETYFYNITTNANGGKDLSR